MCFGMMEAPGKIHGFRVFPEFEDGNDKRSQKRLFERHDFDNADERVPMKAKERQCRVNGALSSSTTLLNFK